MSWINVDEGLADNVRDICQGHRFFENGLFHTLCSKSTDKLSPNSHSLTNSSSEYGNLLAYILVTLILLVIVGILVVVFRQIKKKRREKLVSKRSVGQIELAESGNKVSKSYF